MLSSGQLAIDDLDPLKVLRGVFEVLAFSCQYATLVGNGI